MENKQNTNTWETGKGIQDLLISRCKPSQRIFKIIRQNRAHYFRIFNENEIIPFIMEGNKSTHEIIFSYPRRVYFDVDVKKGETFILNNFLEGITSYISQDELNVYGYTTDEKQSYHITLSNTYINNDEERLRFKEYIIFLKQQLPEIFGSCGPSDSIVDTRVYSVRQAFKCIFQGKQEENIVHDLVPSHCVRALENTFVACFVGRKRLPLFGNCKIEKMYKMFTEMGVSALPTTRPQLPYDIKTKDDISIIPRLTLPAGITREDLNDAKILLNLTPIYGVGGADLGHKHRFKVLNFCMWNGLGWDNFINWFDRHYDGDDYDNINDYTNCKETRTRRIFKLSKMIEDILKKEEWKVSLNYFSRYLGNFYAEFANSHDAITERFISSFNVKGHYNIGSGYVNQDAFKQTARFLIFNVCMGGGKTTATLQYIKNSQADNIFNSFIWFSPRTTLCENISRRMRTEFNINHVSHLEVGKDKSQLIKSNNTMICNQSLHYLRNGITEKPYKYYDVIVIDEIESVLNTWTDDTTHKDNMKNNFNTFIQLIQNAKKVIVLDAFITMKTINFLNACYSQHYNNDMIVIYSDKLPPKKQLVQNDTYEEIINKIVVDIREGKKPYIFYAFKTSKTSRDGILDLDYRIKRRCQELDETEAKTDGDKLRILKQDTKQYKNSLIYFAESDEKNNLGNVNEKWSNADYILTNTSITVGVNYEGLDYDKIYLLCSGITGNPRDIIQTTMRIRQTKSDIIEIFFFDVMNKDFLPYPKLYESKEATIYRDLISSVYIEYHADFIESFKKFCDITNYDYKNVSVIMKRDKLIKMEFINELFESKNLVEFSKVPELTIEQFEEYQTKIYSRTATLIERLAVDKFYLMKRYNILEMEDIAYIWNVKGRSFIPNIKHEIIYKLITEANASQLKDIDIKNVKLTEDMRNLIYSKYSITSRNKKEQNIIAKALNHILGIECTSKKHDDKGRAKGNEFSDIFNTLHTIYERYEELNNLQFTDTDDIVHTIYDFDF